jgi:site-specific DNA-adenine methylase
MGRSAKAGTDGEFDGGLAVRWNAGGGDSAVRFQNAVRSMVPWRRGFLSRCTFVCMDGFAFLDECKDEPDCAVYCDPPWVDDGDDYRHKFSVADHRRLRERLTAFKHARIVLRYGDCPLVRELYSSGDWQWSEMSGRTSANKKKAEVVIVRQTEFA